MFEEVILDNSKEQIAKLYGPADRAHKKPDTGIEVKKKSAYYVIRDCADITRQYLAIHVWGLYDDPILTLKGKFTSNQVKDFMARSEKETGPKLLKQLIVAGIKDKYEVIQTSKGSSSFSYEADADDIYSYYEEYEEGFDSIQEDEGEKILTEEELILKYLF
jgi:hypothetical protein